MRYAVTYEQGATTWGATVPDLGVFAVADSLEEVRLLAAQAVEFHLESLRLSGKSAPTPATLAEYVEIAA